jgi:hypothetical protein
MSYMKDARLVRLIFTYVFTLLLGVGIAAGIVGGRRC